MENHDLKESLFIMQSKLTQVETTVQYLEDECVSCIALTTAVYSAVIF